MASADSSAVYFDSGRGHDLVGIYHLAERDDPAPFALFLHGIPGSEKNHDIAVALRALGWHVLVLHFSGSWGSGGLYDPTEHPTDAIAAIDFALGPSAPRPINPKTIAALGFSLGSRAAIIAATQDERISHVISMSGFADFSEVMLEPSFFAGMPPFLAGSNQKSLAEQFSTLGKGLQPYDAIAQLAPRPVLILHGTQDEIVPTYNADAMMLNAGDNVLKVTIDGANHTFGSHREAVCNAVTGFLGG